MKKRCTLFGLLIIAQSYGSTDTVEVRSTLTDVTVFFDGAQITRTATLQLAPGKYVLAFKQLPLELNAKSLQVLPGADMDILSVSHQTNESNFRFKTDDEKRMEEQIEKILFQLKEIQNRQDVFAIEERFLLDNSKLTLKDGGTTVAEIREAANLYRERLNEVRAQRLELSAQSESLEKRIQDLRTETSKLVALETKVYSRLYVGVTVKNARKQELSVKYFIPSAGWVPTYDFRVTEVNEPLSVVYQANVFQTSGEDWDKVNITLSSGKPGLSGEKPSMKPWFLGRGSPYVPENTARGPSALSGMVADIETGEPMPFVNVMLMQDGKMVSGTTTDFHGSFRFRPLAPGFYAIQVSFVGYENKTLSSVRVKEGGTTYQEVLIAPTAIGLSQFEVVEYASPLIDADRGSVTRQDIVSLPPRSALSEVAVYTGGVPSSFENKNWYYIDGVKVRGTTRSPRAAIQTEPVIHDFIAHSMKSTLTNLEYAIEIPYSVPSDGQDHSIRIKSVEVPVDYVYHAMPALERDVFLTADIPNWSDLNLLSGKASIYYQGTFTGETYIDAHFSKDTLSISLGRDGSLVVEREGNSKKYDRRRIGNNIREKSAWDITLRNNKQVPVKMVVEDQYPLSDRKSISVALLESGNAKVDERSGIMKWELELAPGERRELSYEFEVRYPHGFHFSLR